MQPLAYRPMPASNGAPRSLQHDHSNAVELQNTEIQENLYRMQTHRGLHFRGILVICYMLYACNSKCTGLNLSFLSSQRCRYSVWFGRDHVFRKACFVASYDTGNSIAAAAKTKNTKEEREKIHTVWSYNSSVIGAAP